MTADENIFLKMAAPNAQFTQRMYGVPASITIAQAILESGWGRSALARQANNYFGVKASHVAGQSNEDGYVEFTTAEFEDGKKTAVAADFARYATALQSFIAHARLIATADRYRPAMECKDDAGKFAEKLQDCGYSTNPFYGVTLMQLVREFSLEQYDVPPPDPATAKQEAA